VFVRCADTLTTPALAAFIDMAREQLAPAAAKETTQPAAKRRAAGAAPSPS